MLDVKTWLESTGLKVAKVSFKKPPALPYIVFSENVNVSGADNKNCIINRKISIELYSEKIEYESETKIEDLLNEKHIEYSKNSTWIQTEMFLETVYDFELIEKF